MDGNRHVVLLQPPAECQPGDRVYFDGFCHTKYGSKFFFRHNLLYFNIE